MAVLLVVAFPRQVIHDFAQKDPLQEAKRLAWLNNWSEAAEVLRRSNFNPVDEAGAIFSKAVQIRGSVESTPFPDTVAAVTSMLSSNAAQQDFELRLQLLSIKGDVEFQVDLPAAQKTWEEAKQLASVHDQSQWEARAEGELGSIAFLNGEIFTATKLVTEAFLKAELSDDVAAKMRYCTDLGEGFAQYGRSADAIRFFDKALALAAVTPDVYFPFTAYLGKARLLATTGHPDEGFRMLHSALDESRRKNLKVREARTLTVLGELAASAGRRQEAITSLAAAADVAESDGLGLIEAEASSALASLLRDVGRTKAAEDYARRSVEAAGRAGDLYHLPQLIAVLAEIEQSNGNVTRAEADYSHATRLVDGLLKDFPHPRNKNVLVATMGRVYQGHFDLAVNRSKDLAKAFEILESARAYGLVDVLREPGRERRHLSVLDSQLAPKIAAVNRELSNAQDAALRNRLLDRLWQLEIRALHPHELGASSQAQPVPLRQFQSSLREDDLAIEYALAPSHSFAFAITRNRVVRYSLNGREQIESAVESQLAAVRDRRDSRAESRLLYDLLLQPVTLFKESKTVVVIPDGELHLVAFDCLIDPAGQYVVDSHVIAYAPSATAYYLLSRPVSSPPNQMTLLAVGGAQYTSARPADFASVFRGLGFFDPAKPPRWLPLPESLTEVNDVAAEQRGKTVVLTGDDATESAVKRLPLSNFRMLHFAVHSTVDEEFPDRSALIFSLDKSGPEDNLLQAREIVGLDLNADLVTLSACDAGTGRIEGVAGMDSLVQAFLMAGARSVVATIWPADDTFTAALMRRFYANLRLREKAEALTLAKRELLHLHGPNAPPFYWAGFRLVGDAHGTILGE